MSTELSVEIIDTTDKFRFRLVNKAKGTSSEWKSYSGVAYLEGHVAASEYHLSKTHALKPITSEDFCRIVYGPP